MLWLFLSYSGCHLNTKGLHSSAFTVIFYPFVEYVPSNPFEFLLVILASDNNSRLVSSQTRFGWESPWSSKYSQFITRNPLKHWTYFHGANAWCNYEKAETAIHNTQTIAFTPNTFQDHLKRIVQTGSMDNLFTIQDVLFSIFMCATSSSSKMRIFLSKRLHFPIHGNLPASTPTPKAFTATLATILIMDPITVTLNVCS